MLWTAKKELVDKALRDIAEFENGHTQGMFYRLPRVSVAKGLRERVQKPSTLDQKIRQIVADRRLSFIAC